MNRHTIFIVTLCNKLNHALCTLSPCLIELMDEVEALHRAQGGHGYIEGTINTRVGNSHLTAVEFPGYVRNADKALSKFGGPKAVADMGDNGFLK